MKRELLAEILNEVKISSYDCATIAEIMKATHWPRYVIAELLVTFPENFEEIWENIRSNSLKNKPVDRRRKGAVTTLK